jgi:orotate phosphoribosyltransferase
MKENERNELAKKIFNCSHLTGEFLLRSGVISTEYFDKYLFESDPILLKSIAGQLSEILPKDYDLLAGLEIGGIPLAAALSLEIGKKFVLVRKKAKDYGTCKLAEGPDIAGKKLLIIEDVVTSGGQIILSVNDLRSKGAEVTHAMCVIDREAGGVESLAKNGITLIPLFKMSELKEAVKL